MSVNDALRVEIEACVKLFQSARRRHDWDAALSQMTDDVVLLRASGPPIVGHLEARRLYSSRRTSVIMQNTASTSDFTIEAVGDVALASGIDSAIEIPKDGGPATVFRGPAIYVFRREDGKWKIARAFTTMAPVPRSDGTLLYSVHFVVVIEKGYSSDWPKMDESDAAGNLSDRLATSIQELPDVRSVDIESIDSDSGGAGADGSFHAYGWYEVVKVSIPLILAGGAYAGKKALDVILDLVKVEVTKKIQEKDGRVWTVRIYGPDGDVISTVERRADGPEPPAT